MSYRELAEQFCDVQFYSAKKLDELRGMFSLPRRNRRHALPSSPLRPCPIRRAGKKDRSLFRKNGKYTQQLREKRLYSQRD